MSTSRTFPPLNFHFSVNFEHRNFRKDQRFTSVEGLQARLESDESRKKWLPSFEHLVLKRPFEPNSRVLEWCMNAINNQKFKTIDLTIKLLDRKHEVLAAWIIEAALPVGWGVAPLNAQDSDILIETIELKYLRFQVANQEGKIIAPLIKKS